MARRQGTGSRVAEIQSGYPRSGGGDRAMSTHYSKDGKSAYEIKRLHPECPYHWPTSARSMTSARIDYESAQDSIITWYEENMPRWMLWCRATLYKGRELLNTNRGARDLADK